MNKILSVLLVALLMAGCGDDAVDKLEQRVDELEDELEQVKRDQSYSQGHQRSLFGLFGGESVEASEGNATKAGSPTNNSTSADYDQVDDTGGGEAVTE
jgi:hypothetical protein